MVFSMLGIYFTCGFLQEKAFYLRFDMRNVANEHPVGDVCCWCVIGGERVKIIVPSVFYSCTKI